LGKSISAARGAIFDVFAYDTATQESSLNGPIKSHPKWVQRAPYRLSLHPRTPKTAGSWCSGPREMQMVCELNILNGYFWV